MGTGEQNAVDDVSQRVRELSSRFGEAHGFTTHRIIEYPHWIMSKDGQVIRAFACLGERGEILCNAGSATVEEEERPSLHEDGQGSDPNTREIGSCKICLIMSSIENV